MENASKAILIAASFLIAVMLVALVFVYWGKMSGYFTERSDANRLQQLIKYNNKFENYNNKTIRGNELISIMNMIIDYNNYQSEIVGYEKIEIEIDLRGYQNELQDYVASERLFDSRYIRNTFSDEPIKKISEFSANVLSNSEWNLSWLTETKLQKLSANIQWIADDVGKTGKVLEDYKINRKIKLKEILGREIKNHEIDDIKEVTCLYNQLTLFKRAMFKCKGVYYTNGTEKIENGRVKKMEFEVLTETRNGGTHIKFD